MQLFDRTLGQWLEHWAEETPDKEYIVYSDRNLRFTWSQLNRRVDDMAKGLIAIGVERGTHVGIWAANVPDWLTLLYACAKIGAVYVTVNTNYKQSELEYGGTHGRTHGRTARNCQQSEITGSRHNSYPKGYRTFIGRNSKVINNQTLHNNAYNLESHKKIMRLFFYPH